MITGEPEQALPVRTVVVDLVHTGVLWAATSAQIPGFRVFGEDMDDAKEAAMEELGPHVRIEFNEVGPPPP